MFTRAAAGASNTRGTPLRPGRAPRPAPQPGRGMPETFGELPAVCLAEEIDTPGEGQVKAFVCLAGNPVLSTPNGGRLDAALEGLEFMVAVDIYVNETTRHADVILPAPSRAPEGALRHRAAAARPAQRRQLVRADARPGRGPARRVGGARPARADRPGHGRRRRRSRGRRPHGRLPGRRPPWPTSTARCTAATRRSCSTRWRRGRARPAWST